MPFGLRNAGQTIQRFMNQALQGLHFAYTYIDDVVIASSSRRSTSLTCEHFLNVWKTRHYHQYLQVPLWCLELDFLGHHVDATGIRSLEEKVHAIQAFPILDTQCKLRRFLGLVNFYHRFISSGATFSCYTYVSSKPSVLLTHQHGPMRPQQFLKLSSGHLPKQPHPITNSPTNIMTDASDVAVGAVLLQNINGQWFPLSFFSKALKPAATRYSTYDQEPLAIYLAIRHFRYFLEGRHFHVLTDHKPLIYALSSRPDRHSPQQVRHLDFISQFTTDLRHIQGSANTVADSLSRLETNALHTGSTSVVDFQELALAQAEDPELPRLQADSSL